MSEANNDNSIRVMAEQLAKTRVLSVTAAQRGGNSRVFRVETASRPLAMKSYPTRPGDPRNRADIEWRALRFLGARGVAGVPAVHARDAGGQFLLMEWIDGSPIRAHEPADVTAAA